MSELPDPELTAVIRLTPDQGTEIVADGVADALGELANEFQRKRRTAAMMQPA